MLTLQLEAREIPRIYERFAREIGERSWKERVSAVKREIRGNRYLQHLHLSESAIAFQLDHLRGLHERFGGHAVMDYNDHGHFPAAGLAAQVLSVIDASSGKLADQFRARVRAGIRNNPADLRALRLELTTATHFLRAGKRVVWPEMSGKLIEGQRLCDLLVEDLGPLGLELECKSFATDKGRKITLREAAEFFWLVHSNDWKRLQGIKTGIAAILTVQGKLPTTFKDRLALAKLLASRALSAESGEVDQGGVTVQTRVFDAGKFSARLRTGGIDDQRKLLDEYTGTTNRETVAMFTDAGGALILALQSSDDDTPMDSIVRTLKDSAVSQFTGKRAAVMVAGLDGISADQLLSVATQDQNPEAVPTELRKHASRFLESANREHITGLIFLSAGALRPAAGDTMDSGGTAYVFPNSGSPFWSEDFRGLFGQIPYAD